MAQLSTEAEFGFMTDAGKAALYIRSILEELQLEQVLPTQIADDNRGARQLSNAQQPTPCRHERIRYIAVDGGRTIHIRRRSLCLQPKRLAQ